MRLVLPLNPLPAPRPRVTSKGWTYYPKKYKAWKERAAAILPDILSYAGLASPLTGALRVLAEFVVERPKTTKFRYPRGDLDNYLKTLDCLNGLVWEDDVRIVSLEATKVWADLNTHGCIRLDITEVDQWP